MCNFVGDYTLLGLRLYAITRRDRCVSMWVCIGWGVCGVLDVCGGVCVLYFYLYMGMGEGIYWLPTKCRTRN